MRASLMRNQSFFSLAGAQFFGHFNDNLFKMVVSLIAVEAAQAQAGFYLSLATALLVLPYGSVPEIVAAGEITRANGVLEASRYIAVITGTVTGGVLMEVWSEERYRIGVMAIAIAIGGLLFTRRIKHLDSACESRPWPRHPWSRLPEGLRRLSRSRTLAVAASSITLFESLAALVLLDALLLVKIELGVGDGRPACWAVLRPWAAA
jgi:hypothetical protein